MRDMSERERGKERTAWKLYYELNLTGRFLNLLIMILVHGKTYKQVKEIIEKDA